MTRRRSFTTGWRGTCRLPGELDGMSHPATKLRSLRLGVHTEPRAVTLVGPTAAGTHTEWEPDAIRVVRR